MTHKKQDIRRCNSQGKRLSREEGLSLFTAAPLSELRTRAEAIRQNTCPGNEVSFVLDTNPNYTNICHVGCAFCAFRTNKSAPGAYHKTVPEVMEDIRRATNAGLSTVLLQGGLHEEVTVDYLVSLVRATREQFPSIHPHFFSAPEIEHAARISHMSVREALLALTMQVNVPFQEEVRKSSPFPSTVASHQTSFRLLAGCSSTVPLTRSALKPQRP